jgi:hypothetical protein
MSTFYIEKYSYGWSVWNRETDTNDGFVYREQADAQAVADELNNPELKAPLQGE